ncbi:2-oxo acid dehydrogenase subunit E2 [Halomonas sp. TRM85114]|uniref:2-oxo acid dehydrogenase subunit E2 n=1 Tax=Halomonas jincaotanensis TaxID=2810616 RepID=UPI001BD39E06|nr:2-oxo acid dehydrogenase subunit E2 [Halomonas jincaotanensis]MBS9402492.1 2-oxo acid dehydrogenase subunit E2 [Halomonas jincaotanensis]
MSEFKLPDIGEGIVECEIVEWRVAEGDLIEEDQPVVEVMTDKALVEITAPEAGRVTRLFVPKGEIAKVHAPLFSYDVQGEGQGQGDDQEGGELGDLQEKPQGSVPLDDERVSNDRDAGLDDGSFTDSASAPSAEQRVASSEASRGQGPYGRIPASPAVRRLLREHGLALEDVPGSGKDGRVLKDDVLHVLEQGVDKGSEPAARTDAAVEGGRRHSDAAETRVEPLRGMRAVMARRMVEAATTIPHFHYGEQLDVTDLLALRERLKPRAEAQDSKLTLMPFFMKALALAVQEFPILNARLNQAVDEIHYLPSVNIGMAVDGKAGLMVPNVKGVERLSLLELARETQRLTAEAREGRVAQQDLKGGTISISNIGALGGTYAAPIINAPEVAIVAIGKTQWLPRFDENDNVIKQAILTVTWAGDHRLIDGGTMARFCNAWKGYLEAPETMLLNLS